jgi:hypothetical protein
MSGEIKLKLPELYKKQKRVFFGPEKEVYCIGATKSGKSLGGLVWLISEAINCEPGQNVAWFSLTKPNAKDFFDRLTNMLKGWDESLYTANKVYQTISFAGAGTIVFGSTDNDDTIMGKEFHAVLLDEASRVAEESYIAITSTLSQTKGKLVMVGNALARKNWFQDRFNEIRSNPDFWPSRKYLAIKLDCFDAMEGGVIDSEILMDAKRRYKNNPKQFRLLYLCDTKITGDANPFGHENIRKCLVDGLSPDPAVCYGLDLGSKDDYTVLIGMDAFNRVCLIERFKDSYVQQEKKILSIVDAPCMVEKTGVGMAVYDHLKDAQPFLFYGIQTNSKTKPAMIQELSMPFAKGEISIPRNSILREELDLFEKKESKRTDYIAYGAPAGAHDDCVMALAMCWQMKLELQQGRKLFKKAKNHRVPTRVPKFSW